MLPTGKNAILRPLVLIALSIVGSTITSEYSPLRAFGQNVATVFVSPGNISDFSDTPGNNVTFQVNLANSSSISAFLVILTFNRSIIDVAQNSTNLPMVDYSNNVLANTGGSTFVSVECVDGQPISNPASDCFGLSTTAGSILLAIVILGRVSTVAPTNGLLFQSTFNVKGLGLAQLHLNSVVLANGLSGTEESSSTSDGYFTNIHCPLGGPTFCTPPVASFDTSSPPLFAGDAVSFNGSLSQGTNPGSSIISYSWDWGDSPPGSFGLESANPISSHVYSSLGDYGVTLRVKDTFGISGEITKKITLIAPPPKPGFELSVFTPPEGSYVVKPGQNISVSIAIRSLNGFGGYVNLTISDPQSVLFPPGRILVTPHSTLLNLRPGGFNNTHLFVFAPANATVSSNHTVVVIATGASSRNSTFFLVLEAVPGIELSCTPDFPAGDYCYDLSLGVGQSISLPMSVSSVFGFAGNIALAVDNRSLVGGLTMILGGTRLNLAANQTKVVMVTLSVSSESPLGLNFVQVDAQGSGVSNARLGFRVWVFAQPPPDYRLAASSSVKLIAGQAVSFRLTVDSFNGFSGPCALLFVQVFPSLEGQFSVAWTFFGFQIPRDGSNSTEITIHSTNSTPPGKYTIGILTVAYGGYLGLAYHSMTLTLHVVPPAKDRRTG